MIVYVFFQHHHGRDSAILNLFFDYDYNVCDFDDISSTDNSPNAVTHSFILSIMNGFCLRKPIQ
ncbi:hypothetical protein DERP_003812 [Dermatophagoides pteronyssinus]|uniref:Uncharacterized protein n=1 Tax=Dermatophagoides pteronyssinus TaxID=6956 RepID=A0ABQ8JLP3_DERPT|nr:hypothetical protein DERP_003812 [Dermatophagoides pteronyssinus]